MTFPVRVENGNHVLHTQMHALPRKGDRVTCKFPSIPSKTPLVLQVTGVAFHQSGDEPFAIVITTDDDPKFAKHNAAAVKQALEGE